MLQQTQVARVAECYEPFLKRFPTVRALAASDEQQVLAAWQGLGYYRRARHLHDAARMIGGDFNGRVPRTVADLLRLPGVGRYTAGAIASIVFDRPEPAVDGNVQRVLARWYARPDPPQDRAMIAWCWRRAGELVRQASRPGVFNEALMELGAMVCTPRAPNCRRCPVADLCEARRHGLEETIPPPRPAPPRAAVHHHAVLILRGGKVLLEQRPPAGLWAGMWQVPTVESKRVLRAGEIGRSLPILVNGLRRLGTFEHNTTHRRITFHVCAARIRGSRGRRGRRGWRGEWRVLDDIDHLPMSNAQRRVLRSLQD
jgi:A/G-specific adenine glycosylase